MFKANSERETKSGPSSASQGAESEMEQSASENIKKEVKPRRYTKEELISISKLPCSRIRPKCLENAYNSANGLWNPDKWMTSRNGDNSSGMRCEASLIGAYKRDRLSESQDAVKRKTCDQKERLKEELEDEIVLSPQRRSFGTGCHATAFRNENRSQRDNGHQDNREADHIPHRPRNSQSRVGSGRLAGRERGNEWNDRNVFDKERSFERSNYKDEECGRKGRFNRYDFDNKRSMNSSRNRNYRESRNFEEDEPEWFTSGPTSQNETIELKGFDDSEDVDKLAGLTSESKNRRDSRSQSRSSSHGDFTGDEKRPRSRLSNNSNLSGKVTPIEKGAEDNALGDHQMKEYNQEFDINEIFKMDNWRISSTSTVDNTANTPTNNEDNVSASQAGTSRFAQWFSEGKREQSPIERLFGHQSQIQSSSSEDLIHFLGKQNTSLRSMSGDITENEALYHKNFVRNSDEKDIVHLFQKANINVSGIIQNAVPSAHFDASSVKRVSDLEASLKDSSYSENVGGDSALKKLISCPGNRTSNLEDANSYEHNILNDLLKEDDLRAINQQLQSIDNSGNGSSLAFQNFPAKYGSQREYLQSLRHDNYDPKMNLLIKHSGNSTVSDIQTKSNKYDFGDQVQYMDSPNHNLSVRNSTASNVAAFTPTSVIRKFASEKEGLQKMVEHDESSKLIETSQHHYSVNGVSATPSVGSACMPRPIVKAANLQSGTLAQHQATNPAVTTNSVYNNADYDSLAKFIEQQRQQQQQQQAITAAALTAQRQLNISPMPSAASLRLGAPRTTNPAIRQTLPNASMSVNQSINVPLIRNMVHASTMNPPIRSNTMNPLQFQMLQRGAASLDARQIQALAQTRGLHPVTLQQLLIKAATNIQTHAAAAAAAAVSAAQAQAVAVASLGLTGPRPLSQPMSPTRPLLRTDVGQLKEGLHDLQNHANIHPSHSLYGHHEMQPQAVGQSPENLTKWFGNEVLNQKLPEMPPVPVQKAVLLEDIERQ